MTNGLRRRKAQLRTGFKRCQIGVATTVERREEDMALCGREPYRADCMFPTEESPPRGTLPAAEGLRAWIAPRKGTSFTTWVCGWSLRGSGGVVLEVIRSTSYDSECDLPSCSRLYFKLALVNVTATWQPCVMHCQVFCFFNVYLRCFLSLPWFHLTGIE